MTAGIHPTAIIEKGARIGEGTTIGPYAVIGPEVTIGANCRIAGSVQISGRTEIGANVKISPFAVIGCDPQDTTYKGEASTVRIGDNCIIREHVTIHRGTQRGRMHTDIGHGCFLMVGAHVAHDCTLGHHVTMVNGATIGGFVEIGDYATLGGLAAVQQRLRIGPYAFVGGLTGVNAEIIPYAIAVGDRAELGGLNIVGLKRRGFDRPTIHSLRSAYRDIFFGQSTLEERVDRAAKRFAGNEAVTRVIEFIRTGGRRALCLPRGLES